MYYKTAPGDTVIISHTLYDRNEEQYPQCKLYDSSGTLRQTINLSHIADGHYQGTVTPTGAYKHLTGNVVVYDDSGHTSINETYESTDVVLFVEYGYRHAMGAAPAGIDKRDIKAITDIIEKLIDEKLKKILDKIKTFDPTKEKVDANVNIQKEVTDLKKFMAGQFSFLKDELPEIPNLTDNFLSIQNQIIALKRYMPQKQKEIDMKPILEGIGELKLDVKNSENKKATNEALDKIREKIKQILEGMPKDKSDKIITNVGQEINGLIRELGSMKKDIKNVSKIDNLIVQLAGIVKQQKDNEGMLEALNQENAKRIIELARIIESNFKLIVTELIKLQGAVQNSSISEAQRPVLQNFSNLFNKLKTNEI
jgi:hypothetical protein